MEKRAEVTRVIHDLFPLFLSTPQTMPDNWYALAKGMDETATARIVCDYISGMTDRFALLEHARLLPDH